MDLWRSLSGMVEVVLTSAAPTGTMRAINASNIPIYKVVWIDNLTVQFQVRRSDYLKLQRFTNKRGDRLRISTKRGSYWILQKLLHRPVLILGMLLITILSLWLPSRVLFVRVEGNMAIPTRKILDEAQNCGVEFGAYRRDVRSEKMKNALLEAIPELQWAGINTSGCTAVISVRERTTSEKREDGGVVSSIIAAADGVICEMTVIKGTPLCKVGQAVKAGQVLVSGYTDCGICIRAEQAEAEIFAETSRDLTSILPQEYLQKGEFVGTEKKYSLIIGKKRINFYKGSGILDTTCDKMYTETYMLLPGGFQLPVALITEKWTWHEEITAEFDKNTAEAILSDYSNNYCKEQMIAGQIQQKQESLSMDGGVFRRYVKYICTEMICKTKTEENLPEYAEAD